MRKVAIIKKDMGMKKILIAGAALGALGMGIFLMYPKTGIKPAVHPTSNGSQQVEENINLQGKQTALESVVSQARGEFGVVVQYLETGKQITIGADRPFYAASLTKVPLLITLYRMYEEGKLTPETKVVYLEEDAEWGDGTIQNDPFGTEYPLNQIAWHLAHESDNAAKNILYRVLPWEEILKTYKAAGVAPNTEENIFTTLDMAKFWQFMWEENLQDVFDLLTNTTTEERVPAAVPKGVKVSHKTGTWSGTGSWHDCGIVFTKSPVLICVMSEGSTYKEAVNTIRAVTREALGF